MCLTLITLSEKFHAALTKARCDLESDGPNELDSCSLHIRDQFENAINQTTAPKVGSSFTVNLLSYLGMCT